MEQEYKEDWSFYSGKLDRLHAQRDKLLNDRKHREALELSFAIEQAELELKQTIFNLCNEYNA